VSRLLLGVSGGIAAYKAVETARLAIKAGHAVRVIQTPTSRRFVGVASFGAITGAPVLCGEFETDPMRGAYPGEPAPDRAPINHLALVQRADVYLIAPASANTLAKLAHGHADNLVTTAALAAACPVAVAPAMNDRMYLHPATAANLELLAQRGVTVIGPGEGDLASHGEYGIGRMTEPAALLAACEVLLRQTRAGGQPSGLQAGPGESNMVLPVRGQWSGVRVLVTAGGTREPIDAVRYIGNRSSGRMGFALAGGAAELGAQVTVVAANVSLPPPPGVRVVPVGTAAELADACRREFDSCDVLLMAAAVADFRPRHPAAHKLKKDAGAPTIELERTEDVLSGLAAGRRRLDRAQIVVGFAAEHGEDALSYGRDKLERKDLDAVVVNDISQPGIGFDAGENEVTILTADGGAREVPRAAKERVAAVVLQEVQRLRAEKEQANRTSRADTRSAARV
jgi:phosphopantothenoylcysteine decarboxylase / phosphopantothenate---cysteine ligase